MKQVIAVIFAVIGLGLFAYFSSGPGESVNLGGVWAVTQTHSGITYCATLYAKGNGSYSYHAGHLTTHEVTKSLWKGRWTETGREGLFELELSLDGKSANGKWMFSNGGSGQWSWKRTSCPG